MALLPGLLSIRFFQLLVYKPNGEGLADATVRILNSAGTDVTVNVLKTNKTDSYGQVINLVSSSTLPAGTYTIQVIAPGYQTYSLATASTYTGPGNYTVTVQPLTVAPSSYTVTAPPTYVSPMAPIVFTVAGSPTNAGERIVTTVTHSDNRHSLLETTLDAAGISEIDIRNRIWLQPDSTLVPDGSVSLADLNFSDVITVSFAVVIGGVTVPIGQAVTLKVANLFPPGTTNDLSAYVTEPTARFIRPMKEPIVFRGHYADVMVWLPATPIVGYTLQTRYYDGGGTQVGAMIITNLPKSDFVQRVRLNTLPDGDVRYATLKVMNSDATVTELLKINYRG